MLAALIAAGSARKLLMSVARRVDGLNPAAHRQAMAAVATVDDLIAELS